MRCAVQNCKKFNNDKKQKSHSFGFPKDKQLLAKWLAFCAREDDFDVTKARVCGDHFSEEDYENNLQFEMGLAEKKVLKKGAIPWKPPKETKIRCIVKPKSIQNNRPKEPEAIIADVNSTEELIEFVDMDADMDQIDRLLAMEREAIPCKQIQNKPLNEPEVIEQLKTESIEQMASDNLKEEEMEFVDIEAEMNNQIERLVEKNAELMRENYFLNCKINNECLPEIEDLKKKLAKARLENKDIKNALTAILADDHSKHIKYFEQWENKTEKPKYKKKPKS